jgi:hypothetical protein
MKTRIAIVVAAAFLLFSQSPSAGDRCPTMNDIVAGADRTENLLLDFARAYARSAGLSDLRKLPPSSDELHVRLWHGFGLTGVNGFVLSRTGAIWTAQVIAPGQPIRMLRGARCCCRDELGTDLAER